MHPFFVYCGPASITRNTALAVLAFAITAAAAVDASVPLDPDHGTQQGSTSPALLRAAGTRTPSTASALASNSLPAASLPPHVKALGKAVARPTVAIAVLRVPTPTPHGTADPPATPPQPSSASSAQPRQLRCLSTASQALLVTGVVVAGVVVLALIAVTIWAWHGEFRDARELAPTPPGPSRADLYQQ